MKDYKKFFKGKKITVMGLGLLGRGLGIVKFLAECGADLIVTDLKPSTVLRSSLRELRKYKNPRQGGVNIKYTLGKHQLKDFKDRDMIIKSAGVPLDSPFIKEAKKNEIPVEMDVSLFAKLAPEVQIVGVTGTRGKSMTTALIYEILKKNERFLKSPSTALRTKKPKVFLGGNVRGVATLPLLKKAKPGDILVCELDSWQLQGFGESKISPHIAIFTSFLSDHMNYYGSTSSPRVGSTGSPRVGSTGSPRVGSTSSPQVAIRKYFADKENIFKYQKKGDYLIVRPHVRKLVRKNVKSKLIVADTNKTKDYNFVVPGEHQRENLACAVEVAELFKIPTTKIKESVKKFKGLEGRLQYIKQIRGIKIYNDNNATTPEATIAGIKALYQEGKEGKIILISGGADKNLDLKLFVNILNTFCKAAVFIPGTGTDKLTKGYKLRIANKKVKSLKEAVNQAVKLADKGDIILFSPAFASFGQFNNEYERGDLFMKIVKKLK